MFVFINVVVNVIIFVGLFWVVFIYKVFMCIGGVCVFVLINYVVLGNIVIFGVCYSVLEIVLNVVVVIGVFWGFWRLELCVYWKSGGVM